MSDQIQKYDVTGKDLAKDKALKYTAIALPPVLALVPSLVLFILTFVFGSTPPLAFTFLFASLVSFLGGLLVGLGGSAGTMFYRSRWLSDLREKIAIDGIKAEEVRWFTNELTTEEKRSLKEIEGKNLLLADAYRETLASRLTATRIVKSTTKELVFAKRRRNKLKYLKSERLEEFKAEVEKDITNLTGIKKEADEMKLEAQSRLQMIEAASRRGSELAGNELALKKLSARTEQLPLALEAAKIEDEMRKEFLEDIDKEFNEGS
ncbi:MAG: hypothetical protein KDB79_01360 [Acidobacteria bacterium]|nr:hypothetical protein [Acidobacteriota bacterium]